MVENILANDINSMLLLLNEVINKGFDPQNFIQGMASHLRNLLLGKDQRVIGLMEVSNQLKERYAKQAERCSTEFLLKALDLANECDINFRSANNKRLHLEVALMKMVPQQMSSPSSRIEVQLPQQSVQLPPKAVSTSSPRTQSVEQPTPQPQPASQPKPVAPAPQTVQRVKLPGTISILDEGPKKKEEEAPVEVKNNPFTQEMLVGAWKRFVEKNKNISPNFVAGIGKYEPTLGADNIIDYQIDNMLVVNDINNMGLLRDHLSKELNNNQFKLVHHIVEKPKDDIAYTDRSRFEKMAESNPNVLTLKKGLGLNIDI